MQDKIWLRIQLSASSVVRIVFVTVSNCPLRSPCLCLFRSNVNYIPPPQEVSSSLISFHFFFAFHLWFSTSRSELSCVPAAPGLQTHPVVHALRGWPSFDNTPAHGIRCQHWILSLSLSGLWSELSIFQFMLISILLLLLSFLMGHVKTNLQGFFSTLSLCCVGWTFFCSYWITWFHDTLLPPGGQRPKWSRLLSPSPLRANPFRLPFCFSFTKDRSFKSSFWARISKSSREFSQKPNWESWFLFQNQPERAGNHDYTETNPIPS